MKREGKSQIREGVIQPQVVEEKQLAAIGRVGRVILEVLS